MLGYIYRLIFGYFKACNHSKWEYIGKLADGEPRIQRCTGCGWTESVVEQSTIVHEHVGPKECEHQWHVREHMGIVQDKLRVGIIDVLMCNKCRELKKNVLYFLDKYDESKKQEQPGNEELDKKDNIELPTVEKARRRGKK